MMASSATIEPSASVETPVMPWPTVQPIAVTPPKPISPAPISWLRRSCIEAKPSQRKWPVSSATASEPSTTPPAQAMPKLACSDLSVHSISSSRL